METLSIDFAPCSSPFLIVVLAADVPVFVMAPAPFEPNTISAKEPVA
ncbi:hypothetical protein [Bacillus sp. Bos-x628]